VKVFHAAILIASISARLNAMPVHQYITVVVIARNFIGKIIKHYVK